MAEGENGEVLLKMIFSSLVFLCVFLPITYILYMVLPSLKLKNGLLILVSLLFYAYGEPIYVFLMIFSAWVNYLYARCIAGYPKNKKIFLVVAVAINLGILGVFKYTTFVIQTCNRFFHWNLQDPGILLPVGISFFTFQALSYVIDVYRGNVKVQKSFWKVLLYISFFPQLIAGPIVKYRNISEELENREQNPKEAALGMRRFICGLAKKVLIANTMGKVADQIFSADASSINILVAWIGAISYLLQIYYDFSGYSDMAIGLGRLFGFHFQENFRYPYGATSIKEFWRRWHISLSTWFKEYLYIPLGGNRKGKVRTCVNKIIVFFFTGLWHGANWTFVFWGLYHGLFLLFEEYVPIEKKMPKFLGYIYTLLVVCVGFVIFRADTLSQGFYFIRQMFTGFYFTAETASLAWQQLTPWFLVMFFAGIIGAAPIQKVLWKIRQKYGSVSSTYLETYDKCMQSGMYLLALLALVWCMIRLSGSSYNPFIYFKF
jgi:alginate O-acetyltransferase complex protein AlgI